MLETLSCDLHVHVYRSCVCDQEVAVGEGRNTIQ